MIVNGFLLNYSLPTEDLLNVTVNLSDIAKTKYGGLIWKLKDLLSSVDKEYTDREIRGRTLRGRYPRRSRFQRFSPYPSNFSNRLKSLRRDWYDALARFTVVLTKSEQVGAGWKRARNLYLLPFEKAADLQLVRKELNQKIEALRDDMREYEKSDNWKKIFKALKKISGDKVESTPAKIHDVDLEMYPLSFDATVFKSVIQTRKQKVLEEIEKRRQATLTEIDEKKRADMERLENERAKAEEEILKELEEKRQDLIETVIMDLQGRLAELMTHLTLVSAKKFSKQTAKSVSNSLETIKSLSESVGLKRFVEGYTDSSLKLIEALTTRNKKAIKEATQVVAKEIGIDAKEDYAETLKECALKLSTGVSPRVKALIKAM